MPLPGGKDSGRIGKIESNANGGGGGIRAGGEPPKTLAIANTNAGMVGDYNFLCNMF